MSPRGVDHLETWTRRNAKPTSVRDELCAEDDARPPRVERRLSDAFDDEARRHGKFKGWRARRRIRGVD
ncbi:hypothetical protein F2P81_003741 [Scophthalmus maximus]|uniref:Uncharacterized protein n=1 Tax=Scophthalmus maximus TaxID=52904 RepID=A0A6A4TF07_SCOMX|nr:hypothetical protein F2P81_003741 [Scophthalmus maximus]